MTRNNATPQAIVHSCIPQVAETLAADTAALGAFNHRSVDEFHANEGRAVLTPPQVRPKHGSSKDT